jgi:hypothetical protein
MTDSPREQRHYEPSSQALAEEFPSWHFWEGVNDKHYARLLKSSPPVVRYAPDLQSLRDQIIAYLWKVNH